MDSIVSSNYILVYVHTMVGVEGDAAELCLKQLFTITDNRLHSTRTDILYYKVDTHATN